MKSLRRNIFFILVFTMLLTALCVLGVGAETYNDDATAVAAGAVARVGEAGGEYFTSLPEAVAAAPDGGTVTLIADTTFDESIAITKNLTLTGTGTATFAGAGTVCTDEAAHAFNVSAAVNFTINGDVAVTSGTPQHVLIHITAAANVTVGGNAELTVTGSNNKSYVIWHTDGAGATVTVADNASLAAAGGRTIETNRGKVTFRMTGGTLGGSYGLLFCPTSAYKDAGGTAMLMEISGGTIETANNPIHLDGQDNSAAGTVTVRISNATLKCNGANNACIRSYAGTNVDIQIGAGSVLTSTGIGIYLPNDTKGTLTISDGTVTAAKSGLYFQNTASVSVELSGGAINATNEGILIQNTATITVAMSGGSITSSAKSGISMSSTGKCSFNITGGSIISEPATGSAAIWFNPANNKAYDDCVLTVDGATLQGGLYAICCSGYTTAATEAYITIIIRESDPARPTVLKAVTADNAGARTIRMVDGSQVDLTISGGSISTTAKGDSLIYGSGAIGHTKLTLSGGDFTPGNTGSAHLFLNNGRTFDVTLSGSFNTGEGQTGSYSVPATSVFCSGGGTTNITSTASITSTKVIFRSQLGVMNLTINDGVLSSTSNIAYVTYAGGGEGTLNCTINGGDLTTNNKANMFDARAGEMNFNVYGGILHDGSYMFSYRDFDDSASVAYVARGWTVINMSSGYISTNCSVFVSWKASEANLHVVKGDITCTTTAQEMFMFARWDKPGTYNDGTATSEFIIEGGNFHFTNAGKTLYTAVIGVKGTSTAIVTITGGTLDGGNYGIRARASTRLDITMKGGTITSCTATNGTTTQAGSVIYSETATTNLNLTGGTLKAPAGNCGINIKDGVNATIEIGGTFTIDAKGGTGIVRWASSNGSTLNLNFRSGTVIADSCFGFYNVNDEGAVNIYGGLFIQTADSKVAVFECDGADSNIYGGIFVQSLKAGGNVFYCNNTKPTLHVYGCTAFGARALITNKGAGTPSTKPGESLDATYSAGAPVMSAGAGVRLEEGSNGLRFISTIDGATVAALNDLADAGSVSFGTLIFPAAYLDDLTYYTHDTIPKYLDIAANNGLISDGNGGYTIRAAIVNLKTVNYDREFVAIAYVKYKVEGNVYYRYSALHRLQTARSMTQVARLALLDTKEAQTGSYIHESTVGSGFSKYSAAQQNLLTAYGPDLTVKTIDIYMITGQSNGSGYSHFGSEFRADHAKYTAGFSHVLYSGYACSATGSNPLRHGTLIPTPTVAGFGRTDDYIGAELGLAEALSAYYNETTGKTAAILKYADGGTYLSDNVGGSSARQGNWTSPTYLAAHGATDEILSGNLYRNFIRLVEETVAYYRVLGYEVNLCGMFWMQGCAERNYYNAIPALGNEAAVASPTVDEVNALYTTLFQTLVSDTRNDLGRILGKDLSDMPVIAGSISEAFGTIQSTNQTNFVNMQANMVNEADHTYLLPETRYLVTGTDSSDTAHYSVDDMIYAGNKLGERFLTLAGNGSYIQEPAEEDYVAMVFDGSEYTYFTDLAYAINTAPDGSIVYQLRDVTLYGPLNIATFHTDVVFEGNGFKIDSYSLGHSMKVIGSSTNITFNNMKLINHRDGVNNAYVIYMYAGATLNITGEETYFESYRYGIVINQASTVNISGGTFTTRLGSEIASAAIYVGSASTVTVTGGNFNGVKNGAAFNIETGAANVTISGGTFTPGETASYVIYNKSTTATLTVSDAVLIAGTKGTVYNAGSGTETY